MDNINFSILCKRYTPLIYGAMKKLNIQGAKEEYIQIGVTALFEATENFDSQKGSFEGYAYFLMLNRMKTAMTKINKEQERFVLVEDEFLNQYESRENELTKEQLLTKYGAILTERQKEVFIARYIEERSVIETAALLGITEDAVKNRAREIRKRILKMLEE